MKTFLVLALFFGLNSLIPREKEKSNVIILPPGETIVYFPIILKSGDRLIGSQNSILKLADKSNCPVLVIGNIDDTPGRSEDIFVSGFTIDGNRENQEYEMFGLTQNRNNGVNIRNCANVFVSNLKVKNCISGGIVLERGCERVIITNCESTNNYFDGLAAYVTENCFFSDLVLSGNLHAGMSFDLGFNSNLISNVLISGNGHQGIFMRDSNNNYFQGGYLISNLKQGIFIAKAEGETAASNNIFYKFNFFNNKENLRINDKECIGNRLIEPVYNDGNYIVENLK